MLTENFQVSEHVQYQLVKQSAYNFSRAIVKKDKTIKKILADLFSKPFGNN